jgi:CheY-like chemotaxis protein
LELVIKTKFDIIMCDLNMPGIDGFQTCTKIRELLSVSNKHSKSITEVFSIESNTSYIVAISASVFTDHLTTKCRLAGFDSMLMIPISA